MINSFTEFRRTGSITQLGLVDEKTPLITSSKVVSFYMLFFMSMFLSILVVCLLISIFDIFLLLNNQPSPVWEFYLDGFIAWTLVIEFLCHLFISRSKIFEKSIHVFDFTTCVLSVGTVVLMVMADGTEVSETIINDTVDILSKIARILRLPYFFAIIVALSRKIDFHEKHEDYHFL